MHLKWLDVGRSGVLMGCSTWISAQLHWLTFIWYEQIISRYFSNLTLPMIGQFKRIVNGISYRSGVLVGRSTWTWLLFLIYVLKFKFKKTPPPPQKKEDDEKTTSKYRASVKVFVFHCYKYLFHCYKYRSVFLVLDCDIVMT